MTFHNNNNNKDDICCCRHRLFGIQSTTTKKGLNLKLVSDRELRQFVLQTKMLNVICYIGNRHVYK
jgi:hypothetical protein